MNARLRPTLWLSLLLPISLTQCIMEPPTLPPGANSGYSLDSGPSLRRSREETRYLESTQPPQLPNPGPYGDPSNPTDLAGPPAPTYETPPEIDSNLPPAPEKKTEPDTAFTTSNPPTTNGSAPPAATTKPAGPEQLPFGLPVPSKKGFVYSPFDKTQMVDVRGIPPGKKVRCPYTSKIFLVP
jgi:hypothetical protein